MTDDEETLYDFCDELLRTQASATPPTPGMVAAFGEQGVIDTMGIVGYYTMLAMVLNTARTPAPDNGAPRLPTPD